MVKRAVVAGINDYSVQRGGGTNPGDLSSCVRDANSMYHLLVEAFGFERDQTYIYTDSNASRENILRALRYLVRISEAGDVICFYYSGHGARLPARTGQGDPDKYYEALVPFSGDFITDWELYQIADRLEQSAVNFTVLLDSCHSGGMHPTDRAQKVRTFPYPEDILAAILRHITTIIPCGIIIPPTSDVCRDNVSNPRPGPEGIVDLDWDPDKTLVRLSKASLVSACAFSEYSWEVSTLGHGLFTQSILDLVNQSNFEITYRDFHEEMRDRVDQYMTDQIRSDPQYANARQTPQLRGQMNRMEENFLAGWTQSR